MNTGETSIRNIANGRCVRCGSPSMAGQIVGGAPGVMFYPKLPAPGLVGETKPTALYTALRYDAFACSACGMVWFETKDDTADGTDSAPDA